MWSNPLLNSRQLSVVPVAHSTTNRIGLSSANLEKPPDVSPRQSLVAILRHKKSWVRIVATGEISPYPLEGTVGEEYDALLIAFAYDFGFPCWKVNVRDVQRQYLTNTHAGAKDHLN